MAKRKRQASRPQAPQLATVEQLLRIPVPKKAPQRDPAASQRLMERVWGPGTFGHSLAHFDHGREHDARLREEVVDALRREEIRKEILTAAPGARAAPRGRPAGLSVEELLAHYKGNQVTVKWIGTDGQRAIRLSAELKRPISGDQVWRTRTAAGLPPAKRVAK